MRGPRGSGGGKSYDRVVLRAVAGETAQPVARSRVERAGAVSVMVTEVKVLFVPLAADGFSPVHITE